MRGIASIMDSSLPPAELKTPVASRAFRSRGVLTMLVALAVLLPLVVTAALHWASLRVPVPIADAGPLVLREAMQVADSALMPPSAAGSPVKLPLFQPSGPSAPRPSWVLVRFALERPADTTWALSFAHRTSALVFLDGRLLANSVPLVEADLPPRNLQIGERLLEVNVPADWLSAGEHVLAVRLGAPGSAAVTLSAITLGPATVVEEADFPRRFGLALRLFTALSALVIGTLLLFTWLIERHERLYLWSALQLLMLALLLSPYLLGEPLLPSPWWRMSLDAADIIAKGLAPIVIAAWAPVRASWVRSLAFGYIALALPVDLLAAYHLAPWTDFRHPWPWWALISRLAILGLAVVVSLMAFCERPGTYRFGTAVLAALALWIWADVSVFALVLPGVMRVVDLNVVAYAGWALWVAVLLHHRLVGSRRQEVHLRAELADQLAARSEELREQYVELRASERARATAAERERLLAEMHDGVGGQLTSAKMLASSGQLSNAEIVDILDDCLREMRLTVDALSVTDGDLGLLLATLRSRLEPALRAGGLVLDWRVDVTPHVPALHGAGGREFVRIMQEALSNIVHHAKASRVAVGTRLSRDGTHVQVSVEDDGLGMAGDFTPGRGLRNMRQRAQRISAVIAWSKPVAPARGTLLTIELPLSDPGQPAAA
jgi:signal transduction histidine kinase